jgi:hypothetical protein
MQDRDMLETSNDRVVNFTPARTATKPLRGREVFKLESSALISILLLTAKDLQGQRRAQGQQV